MPAVRFCSACGAELPSSPPVECRACGTAHWLNPKPGAAAVVVEDGCVLLARRAHDPWRARWGTPAGFCEPGEHPIETAVREAFEETGLPVDVTGYLGVWVSEYTDDPDEPHAEIINVSYYLAVPARGRVGSADPAEVSEVEWFAWDELPANLAPPGMLEVVLSAARAAVEGRGTSLPDRPSRRIALRRRQRG